LVLYIPHLQRITLSYLHKHILVAFPVATRGVINYFIYHWYILNKIRSQVCFEKKSHVTG
jgi:hypothetical protein